MSVTDSERIVATYRLSPTTTDPRAAAEAIALEQTVELPRSVIDSIELPDHVLGRVEQVDGDRAGARATLSYDAAIVADGGIPALLNLVFGNVSLLPGVRLEDVALPKALLERFDGPGFGVEGVRALTGVQDRPLLATALKPRGTRPEALAAMAGAFARGGGDIVKDDQNLVDALEPFKRRVELCGDAVDAANQRTGRRCLYLPHVAAPAPVLPRYFDHVARLGLPGVLACPFIAGLDTVRALAAEHGLVLMAHPALAGSFVTAPGQGIDHAVVLGTLLRLAGVDISIFPNVDGRFAFTRDDCARIAARLREPLGGLRPAWPCPAGGMTFERIPQMCADYGPDTVLLIGGALLAHGEDLESSTRAFADAVRANIAERLEPPATQSRAHDSDTIRVIRFENGFEWSGRTGSPYKDAADLTFKGVRRVELIGKFGEATRTDLRYFEIEPGGHSSLEKHLHTHIVIGARGQGVLVVGNRRETLAPMDVAHIGPLDVHQLRNETSEPFGFFCIVDHERDRPMAP